MNASFLCGLVKTQSASKADLPTMAAAMFVIRYPVGTPTAKSIRRGRIRDNANICGHFRRKKNTAYTSPIATSNGRLSPAVEGDSHRFKYWKVHPIINPKSHTNTRRFVPVAALCSRTSGWLIVACASPADSLYPVVSFDCQAARHHLKFALRNFWRKSVPSSVRMRHISCSRERMRSPIRSPRVSPRTAARAGEMVPATPAAG